MRSLSKKKFYVVWKGRNPGIFSDWKEAENQVSGFPGAIFKSFSDLQEAEKAWKTGFLPETKKSKSFKKGESENFTLPQEGIAVDAACNMKTGDAEYRGVNLKNNEVLFKGGPFKDATNNIVEFLAIVHALAYCKKYNLDSTPIYSDSQTALSWVAKGKSNTKKENTNHNSDVFNLILRAEDWLKKNKYHNPLIKWDTKIWGEIPADFGRK